MKANMNISILGIFLGIFACVANGRVICDYYDLYHYTYCDDGYYCCNTFYCCYGSSGTISGGSSNYDNSNDESSNDDSYTDDFSSSGLSVAVIIGIVIGGIVFAAVMVTICVAFIYGCSKTGQNGNVITPVQAAQVQMVSADVTPMTHPQSYSHTVHTGHPVYNQSLPGTVTTGDTEC